MNCGSQIIISAPLIYSCFLSVFEFQLHSAKVTWFTGKSEFSFKPPGVTWLELSVYRIQQESLVKLLLYCVVDKQRKVLCKY